MGLVRSGWLDMAREWSPKVWAISERVASGGSLTLADRTTLYGIRHQARSLDRLHGGIGSHFVDGGAFSSGRAGSLTHELAAGLRQALDGPEHVADGLARARQALRSSQFTNIALYQDQVARIAAADRR